MAAHEGKVGLISATAIWRRLVTIDGRVKPRLVTIDTLADVFAGNENARQFGGDRGEVAASCLACTILVRRKNGDVSIRLTEKARPARYRSQSDA